MDIEEKHELALLTRRERSAAGLLSAILFGTAILLTAVPPIKNVALANCSRATDGCIVGVDSDLTTLAITLAGIGAALALIAVLGLRFSRIKGPGVELESWNGQTGDLPKTAPPQTSDSNPSEREDLSHLEDLSRLEIAPLHIEEQRVGQEGVAPVAVTRLNTPLRDIEPAYLRDYQSCRRASQHGFFLAHILGPPARREQRYAVAIKLIRHRSASGDEVRAASFYLGRAWGHHVFPGERGGDGNFGIVTEAYGPFLVLCEVEFSDDSRILLDHYCDFESGVLVDR
ncbi:pYEATS domain-containing protein [Actinomycetospora sp. NBC_00405]|uniref:pYEATS domain-containing protein n=1 Tax=Actinomycetospora sp. NBC_00405 TaxID=2975952 RepID=UPI002E1C19F9